MGTDAGHINARAAGGRGTSRAGVSSQTARCRIKGNVSPDGSTLAVRVPDKGKPRQNFVDQSRGLSLRQLSRHERDEHKD